MAERSTAEAAMRPQQSGRWSRWRLAGKEPGHGMMPAVGPIIAPFMPKLP